MYRNRNETKSTLSVYASKLKSDYSTARSRISSTFSRISKYENEKAEIRKSLPVFIRFLQVFLSIINFLLFCFYVLLFGFTISSIFMAINEDCLNAKPSYEYVPERVTPNTISGYQCTGVRLIEENDLFQLFLLVLLTVSIGTQMVSSNFAFIGSVTLTVKNIKISIGLFVLSTILLISFFAIDFPLSK